MKGETMKKLFSTIPTIRGENIELRRLQPSDAAGLKELTDCDEVYRYLPTFLFEKKYDDAEYTISRMYDECLEESLILGVFYRGEFCGLAEIYGYVAPLRKVSLGNRFLPRFWGKGISSETLGLMVDYLFNETEIKIITTSVMPDNNASKAVLKKNGFKCALPRVFEDWGHSHPTVSEKWIRTAADHSGEYSFNKRGD